MGCNDGGRGGGEASGDTPGTPPSLPLPGGKIKEALMSSTRAPPIPHPQHSSSEPAGKYYQGPHFTNEDTRTRRPKGTQL